MTSFVKSVTFDCASALVLAGFWAAALGSNVDEDSTDDKAWVEPAGWGGPTLWFQRVPEGKTAKNRQHFDLRAMGSVGDEVGRLVALGATVLRDDGGELVVMADPEGNEFCVES
ncbi:VOC family protein [Pedococcus bigeumensis]|uniref:VOC family protein n=1 Tax=Pedococcus bigeumensis TaxID=433644 RepID=UPI002FE7B377